jgi:hypothetical protein
VNTKAALGLTAGALLVGLLGGIAIANNTEPTKAPEVGPTKTVAGVPVGYERTTAGAIAAATRYSRVISDLTLADTVERDRGLAVLSSSGAKTDIQAKARAAFEVIDKGLGLPDAKDAVVLRSAAVGHKVVSFTRDAATIEIWSVDILGKVDQVAPQAGWGVSTFDLKWEMDDWKLVSFPTQVPGPTPAVQGAPSPEDLARIRALAEIPNAFVD